MNVEKTGDWELALKITKNLGGGKHMKLTQVFMRKEGGQIVKRVRELFNTGGNGKWAPLAEATLMMRRAMGFKGSKILVKGADLRNSVAVHESGSSSDFVLFIGVNRSAAHNGKPAVSIAFVHEFGATIQVTVTRKMQRFLMSRLGKVAKSGRNLKGHFIKKGTKAPQRKSSGNFRVGAKLTIRIPARPFMKPEIEKYTDQAGQQDLASRLGDYIAANLKT